MRRQLVARRRVRTCQDLFAAQALHSWARADWQVEVPEERRILAIMLLCGFVEPHLRRYSLLFSVALARPTRLDPATLG